MKNRIPCEIIKDLLPSYIDELTSEQTNAIVKEHLLSCKECRETAKRMGKAEDIITEEDEREIDFLKKSKKKTVATLVMLSVMILCLCIMIMSLIRLESGLPIPKENIQINQLEVEGKTLNIGGYVDGHPNDVKEVEFWQDNGIVYVSVRPSIFSIHTQNGFKEEYVAYEEIQGVCLTDEFIYFEGEEIDGVTSKIYNSKQPYVGNVSLVQRAISDVGLGKFLGEYELKIQSEKMPYGITLASDRQFGSDIRNDVEMRMKQYATILIGVIDNLSYVTCEFYIDDELTAITVDVEEANALAGNPVKEQLENPVKLKEMLKTIGFINEFA